MKGYSAHYRDSDKAVLSAGFCTFTPGAGESVATGILGNIPELFGPYGQLLQEYDSTKNILKPIASPVVPPEGLKDAKQRRFALEAAKKEATAAGDAATAAEIQKKIDALPK